MGKTWWKVGTAITGWMMLSGLGVQTDLSNSLNEPPERKALIGHWNCEDKTESARLITDKVFASGGQAVVGFHLKFAGVDGHDEMAMTMAGNWRLSDGILYEQGVAFKFSTLNVGGEDMLGSELEDALTVEMRQNGAASRVVDLTADRLILTPLNNDERLTCVRKD